MSPKRFRTPPDFDYCYTECSMLHRTAVFFVLTLLAFAQAQGAVAAQNAPVAAPVPTVLVLPLENSGRDARLNWLGEGLAVLTIERLAGEGRALDARNEAGDRP